MPLQVYHAGDMPLADVTCSYTLSGVGDEHTGQLSLKRLPIGKNIDAGAVVYSLSAINSPTKGTLSVVITDNVTGSVVGRNHWEFWVYPSHVDAPSEEGIYIADKLTDEALEALKQGGKVLLTAAGNVTYGNDVVQHYLPVFWNTSWFKMRPPHTTGAAIDTAHPLFAHGFPTDDWSNLNWWELLNKAQVMNLSDFPLHYQSPIQPIDTWHISRKLGMLVEAKVLGGQLLMTTMDVTRHLESRPVARQMRHAIVRYMQSADFAPSLSLEPSVIADLFVKVGPKVDMYTNGSPDELKPAIVR